MIRSWWCQVIPPSLFSMPSLVSFVLYGNKLTGTLPSQANNNLRELILGSNSLTGTVSRSLFTAGLSLMYVYLRTSVANRNKKPNCYNLHIFTRWSHRDCVQRHVFQWCVKLQHHLESEPINQWTTDHGCTNDWDLRIDRNSAEPFRFVVGTIREILRQPTQWPSSSNLHEWELGITVRGSRFPRYDQEYDISVLLCCVGGEHGRDLSFNHFNSTIPQSYSSIQVLALENNALQAPLPAFLLSEPISQSVLLMNNSLACPLVCSKPTDI